MKPCWCGHQALERFSPHYARCMNCQTLVSQSRSPQNLSRVDNDAEDFYGKNYWLAHMAEDFGYPDFFTRAVSDLPERGLFWLRTLLKYKLPPANTLELGCAHGGSVAMLHWAGFDAMGLELSPWVVDFSRRTFDIPVLLGPVEDQAIEPASLDVISLMDVLEHLPNPAQTMRHCLQLLKPDGLLLIQTPHLPETQTYEHMQAVQSPFLEQLKHDEHLYLFSQAAITQFFQRLDAPYLSFEPAIFAHYDMFVVVSRCHLPVHSTTDIQAALSETVSGRLIRALLDLDEQKLVAHRTFTAKQNEQHRQIDQLQTEKQHWEQTAHDLQDQVGTLQQRVTSLETECHIQSQLIEHQRQTVTQLQDDHILCQKEIQHTRAQLQEMTRAHATLQQAHTTLQENMATLTTDHLASGTQLHLAQSKLEIAQSTRVYRLLHRLGRWKFMDSQSPTSHN